MKTAIILAVGALVAMVVIASVDVVKPEADAAEAAEAADGGQEKTGTASRLFRMLGVSRHGTRASGPSAVASPGRADESAAADGSHRDDVPARGHAATASHEAETARSAANSGGAVVIGSGETRAHGQPSGASQGIVQGSPSGPTGTNSHGSSQTSSSSSQGASTSKGAAATVKSATDKPSDACSKCESVAHDDNMSCPDSYTNCRSLPGTLGMDHRTMPGMSKAALCLQILDCMHQTKCAGPNAGGGPTTTDCLCGRDIDPDKCFKSMTVSQTQGACRDLMVAGTETEDLEQIAMRFFDHTTPTGAAVAVLETCDIFSCARECL